MRRFLDIFVPVVFACIIITAGCGESEDAIMGTWTPDSRHLSEVDGYSFEDLTFMEDGTFMMNGEAGEGGVWEHLRQNEKHIYYIIDFNRTWLSYGGLTEYNFRIDRETGKAYLCIGGVNLMGYSRAG